MEGGGEERSEYFNEHLLEHLDLVSSIREGKEKTCFVTSYYIAETLAQVLIPPKLGSSWQPTQPEHSYTCVCV